MKNLWLLVSIWKWLKSILWAHTKSYNWLDLSKAIRENCTNYPPCEKEINREKEREREREIIKEGEKERKRALSRIKAFSPFLCCACSASIHLGLHLSLSEERRGRTMEDIFHGRRNDLLVFVWSDRYALAVYFRAKKMQHHTVHDCARSNKKSFWTTQSALHIEFIR